MTFTAPGTVGPGYNESISAGVAPFASVGPPDPLGLGFASTVDPALGMNAAAVDAANAAYFYRLIGYGFTANQIRLLVGTSSGNVDVGIYAGTTGTGTASLPGVLLTHSGAVACPIAGTAQAIAVPPVTIPPGAWVALAVDNTTATFLSVTGTVISTNGAGRAARQVAAMPLPPLAAAVSPILANRQFWLAAP